MKWSEKWTKAVSSRRFFFCSQRDALWWWRYLRARFTINWVCDCKITLSTRFSLYDMMFMGPVSKPWLRWWWCRELSYIEDRLFDLFPFTFPILMGTQSLCVTYFLLILTIDFISCESQKDTLEDSKGKKAKGVFRKEESSNRESSIELSGSVVKTFFSLVSFFSFSMKK